MKIVLLLCALILAPIAEAKKSDPVNSRARALLHRLQKSRSGFHALATPLLRFYVSPENPVQGENVSVVVEAKLTFSGRTVTLDAELDGNPVAMRQPSTALWTLPLGAVTEAKTHQLIVKEYIESTQDNLDLRDAIRLLDSNITTLTNQINAEREAGKRKILQAQRSEKIALKNELVDQLRKLRNLVGEQTYSFKVGPVQGDPTFPTILSITPSVGTLSGGGTIVVSGQNFTPNFSGSFSGVPAPGVEYVNPQTVELVVPTFATTGAKDLELSFQTTEGRKNTTLLGGFFVTSNAIPSNPLKPVAVAAASQWINLGQGLTLDGSQSYDPNNDPITFEWKVITSPAGSGFSPGQILPSSVSAVSFTPDKAGTYVVQLIVKEALSEMHLESDPSLAVVLVKGSPQPTVAGLVVGSGKNGTVQVFANNPDETHTYSISSQATHGEVSVSTAGLVSYRSERNYLGPDAYELTLTSQSGTSATVGGEVSVVPSNVAPQPTADRILVKTGFTSQTQVLGNDPDTDQSLTYAITSAPSSGTAEISSSGLVSYTAGSSPGTDSLVVTVTDDGNPSLQGTVSIPVTIAQANRAPVASAEPIDLNISTTGYTQVQVTDPDEGQQFTYTIIGATSLGSATISPTGLVTFQAGGIGGTGSILVLVTDNGNPPLSSTFSIPVTINNPSQAPVIGNLTYAILSRGLPYNVLLGSDNLITNPAGTITEVRWSFGDGTSEFTLDPSGFLSHNYIQTGTYVAELKVTNSLNLSTVKRITVHVVDTDIPTAKFTFTASGVVSPVSISFDASASSDADGIVNYRWNWGENPALSADEVTTSSTASHTYSNPGVYTVRLITEDANHAVGMSNFFVFVDVTPPVATYPAIPDFSVNPARRVVLGDAFTLDGNRSFNPNPDGIVSQYTYNFSDGQSCSDGCEVSGSDPIQTYTYPNVGTYFPSLRVNGLDGVQAFQANQEIYVVNTGFAPRAVSYADVTQGVAPLTVNFFSESYDSDGSISFTGWGFNDEHCTTGCNAEGISANYTYPEPGIYFPALLVVDNDGNSNIMNRLVEVLPAGTKLKRVKTVPPSSDLGRENKRRILTNLCGKGQAQSCFSLSKMYEEDGNSSVAEKLKQRSCSLGYQDACVLKALR